MPLFGSKKHHNDEDVTGMTGNTHGLGHATNHTGPGIGPGTGFAQPGGAMGTGHTNDVGYPGGAGYQSGIAANSMGGPMAAQMGGHGPLPTSQMNADPYTSGGTGPHTLGQNERAHIPPSQQLDRSHGGSRGSNGSSSGQRLTGKIEAAIGSAVGSSALKAKGEMKQQEANAVKMQSAELAEAERLEREALMRRERAVGHGANPANSTLGGGHTGTGPSGVGPFNNNM